MLRLAEVNLSYALEGKGQMQVLKNINLTIPTGERWAIIGPSGCGKSSLLNLMAGLLQPTSGAVYYNEKKITAPHPEIGVILQEYGLFPWKTVEKNVVLPLVLQKKSKEMVKKTLPPILQELGLWAKRNQYPNQLSGGQRQRVAIARVLAMEPQVWLMDEPFSALDALTRESLQALVLSLCHERQLTLVMVTHNIEEAVFLGEKIVVFNQDLGHIAHIVANPYSGQVGYRNTPQFYEQCAALRLLIRGDES